MNHLVAISGPNCSGGHWNRSKNWCDPKTWTLRLKPVPISAIWSVDTRGDICKAKKLLSSKLLTLVVHNCIHGSGISLSALCFYGNRSVCMCVLARRWKQRILFQYTIGCSHWAQLGWNWFRKLRYLVVLFNATKNKIKCRKSWVESFEKVPCFLQLTGRGMNLQN